MTLVASLRRHGTSTRPSLPARALRARTRAPWLLLLGACLLAILTGLIATTASPIAIGLFAGSIAGIALLGYPTLCLWLVLVGTLVIGGLIAQFAPALAKANWLFSMLGFLLLLSAMGIAITRRSSDRPHVPWWGWFGLSLPLYAVLVAVINQVPTLEFLAGFKRYFQYWGVFACLALVMLKGSTYRSIVRFLVALALVQVFFAAYQRVFVVPQRIGMGGGVVAIDAVSGTFESSFTGGGSSSVLVFFLLIVFAFELRLWLDGGSSGPRALVASILLLMPLALGETKVVVAFLPTVLVCALLLDFKPHPVRALLLLVAGAAATVALAFLYLLLSAKAGQSWQTVIDNVIAYNFGSVGYHSASGMNRSTVLSFWWSQQGVGDPLGFLFGHGPGASYSGDGSLVPGTLALRYPGLAIGFTTLSALLWDLGVLGMVVFVVFNLAAVLAIGRAALRLPSGVSRSLAVAVLAGLLMNLVLCFMGNSATALPSHATLYALLLGAAVLISRQARRVALP